MILAVKFEVSGYRRIWTKCREKTFLLGYRPMANFSPFTDTVIYFEGTMTVWLAAEIFVVITTKEGIHFRRKALLNQRVEHLCETDAQ